MVDTHASITEARRRLRSIIWKARAGVWAGRAMRIEAWSLVLWGLMYVGCETGQAAGWLDGCGSWPWLVLGAVIVAGLVAAWFPWLTDWQVATLLDVRAGGHTLATALLTIEESEFLPAIAERVLHDVPSLGQAAGMSTSFPWRTIGYGAAVLILHFATRAVPSPPTYHLMPFAEAVEVTYVPSEPSFTSDPSFVVEKAEIERMLKEALRQGDEKAAEHLRKLLRLMEDLEKGRISIREALERLSRMTPPAEDEVNKELAEDLGEAMQEVGRALRKDRKFRDLGRALEKRDPRAIEREMMRVQRHRRERDLARALARASKEAARNFSKMARELERRAKKAKGEEAKRLARQAARARRRARMAKAMGSPRELARMFRQAARQAARRGAARTAQRLRRAAQRTASSRSPNHLRNASRQYRKAREAQRSRQSARQAGRDLRDVLRRLRNSSTGQRRRRGSSSGAGSSQRSGSTARSGRAGQGGRRGSRPSGASSGAGSQGGKRSGSRRGGGRTLTAGDFLRKARGGSQKNGKGAGTGHDSRLFGRESTLPSRARNQEVMPHRHAQGEMRRQTIEEAASRGFSSRGYKKVYVRYRNAAPTLLKKTNVPPSYRHLIRIYYKLIGPGQ